MNIILIIIAFFSIISAFAVLISNNPVFATLFLILVFFFSSLFLFFLGLDFLAFIFIIIYIGAIAVLFLFVVMMLRISHFRSLKNDNNKIILVIISFILLIFNFLYLYYYISDFSEYLYNNKFIDFNYIKEVTLYTINANSIGLYFYTHYGIIFIMSGIILLIGMVGAIILTLQKNYNIRKQYDYKQILTKYKKNISLKINK